MVLASSVASEVKGKLDNASMNTMLEKTGVDVPALTLIVLITILFKSGKKYYLIGYFSHWIKN